RNSKTMLTARPAAIAKRIAPFLSVLAECAPLFRPARPRPARKAGTHTEESTMWHGRAIACALAVAVAPAFAAAPESSRAETGAQIYGPNDSPNPYKYDYGWAKLPDGRKWGAAVGVAIDRDGRSVWVFDRCESATDCSKSKLDPIMQFDST